MEECGKDILIFGYVFLMLSGEIIKELILVFDMGFCLFCGNGDYGVNLQVMLVELIINFDESICIMLWGNIKVVIDFEIWQFVIMEDVMIIVEG